MILLLIQKFYFILRSYLLLSDMLFYLILYDRQSSIFYALVFFLAADPISVL